MKLKNDLGLLIFAVDMLIGCLSQQICVRTFFLSRTERFRTFYFVSSTSKLGLPRVKSLLNGVLVFLVIQRKIESITAHKMASHLMHMNVIFFKENMCLTDANHNKQSKMTIFDYLLT